MDHEHQSNKSDANTNNPQPNSISSNPQLENSAVPHEQSTPQSHHKAAEIPDPTKESDTKCHPHPRKITRALACLLQHLQSGAKETAPLRRLRNRCQKD